MVKNNNKKQKERKFVNILRPPFQLTKYFDTGIYVLQKQFMGNRYQKVGFKEHEATKLAELLYKIKAFRVAFKKIKMKKK